MSPKSTPPDNQLPERQAVLQKVREAEAYDRQGLFADALDIYFELVHAHRRFLDNHPGVDDATSKAAKKQIDVLEDKIESIQVRSKAFECRHEVLDRDTADKITSREAQVGAVLDSLGIGDVS
jgi:hypothetical protein